MVSSFAALKQVKCHVQASVHNQDAAFSAGAMFALLDLVAAGPDSLAASTAALAISMLVAHHAAVQDAVR